MGGRANQLDFAQDGYIGKYDEFDIAEACMWVGDHQSFVDALIQAGFVDKTEAGLLINIIDDVITREDEFDFEESEAEPEPEPVDLKLVVKRHPCNSRPIGQVVVVTKIDNLS